MKIIGLILVSSVDLCGLFCFRNSALDCVYRIKLDVFSDIDNLTNVDLSAIDKFRYYFYIFLIKLPPFPHSA